eukprot:9531643-Alexandrium_andersonii.AAC.1
MSASLVGSEMCIRDSPPTLSPYCGLFAVITGWLWPEPWPAPDPRSAPSRSLAGLRRASESPRGVPG